ncbi:MAG: 30S ribosomal protein S16 [Erysipelotrichales bacterium]|nr:30S ribosomal protein S16 [Erysipelotrichales bacterium]
MVKLRLQRCGSHKKPFYRIVVANSVSPRDGSFIEILGTYNSVADPAIITINEEKVMEWLKKGAKPTETVRSILSKQGIIEKFAKAPKSL